MTGSGIRLLEKNGPTGTRMGELIVCSLFHSDMREELMEENVALHKSVGCLKQDVN